MKTRNDLFWAVLPYVFGLCLSTVYGCHLIFPFETAPCARYDCTTDIYRCVPSNQQLQGTVSKPTPQGACYEWLPATTATNNQPGLRIDQKIYCDANWRVKKIQLPELKGCSYIRGRFQDNNSNVAEFLRFPMTAEIDKVFVAYDDRFTDKPYWLTALFDKKVGLGYEDLYVTISKPDQPNLEVDLEIWEMKTLPNAGDPIVIPGNLYQDPKWPAGFPVSNAAMYVVIIKPKQDYDCTNRTPNYFVGQDKLDPCSDTTCYGDEASAESLAVQLCEQSFLHGTHVCVNADCTPQQKCPPEEAAQDYSLTLGPRAFLRSSEIEFKNTPSFKAVATITMLGGTYQSDVDGILHFQYDLDEQGHMWTLTVNSMILNLSPVNTSEGTFSNIVVALLDPVSADCLDTYPPYATPCDQYRIPADTFTASTAANKGDDLFFVVAQNENDHTITIDHANRVFQLLGSVSTTIKVNDEDSPVVIDIDVKGKFLNFAPQANGNESTRFVECSERANKDTVSLDASVSFDIDGTYGSAPLPNAIAVYEWYEDFGLVTEKSWGSGKKVSIGKYQLSYGVHDITLVVKDTGGVSDQHTFPLEVQDTIAPGLTVPQDIYIYRFQTNPPPEHVNIGQASSWDMCSDEIVVTNNAPANGMFGPGIHSITWKADDGTGNVATAVQKVLFFKLEAPKLWELPFHLAETITSNKWQIHRCGDVSDCSVDLASLVGIVAQAREQIQGVWEGEEQALSQILDTMGSARQSIIDADTLLNQSNGDPEGALELRASAQVHLDTAAQVMSQATGLLSPPELPDGIWKDVPFEAPDVRMNFYVQTYGTGSILVVASPDGGIAYAFLDEDMTDGVDVDDLGGARVHLTAQFTADGQGTATMTREGFRPVEYTLYRWFASSPSDSYQGIWKDAPPMETAAMSIYVQTYESSVLSISSPDARSFMVFLDPDKGDGLDATAMVGGEHFTCDFSQGEPATGSLAYPEGEPAALTLYRWFPSLTWSAPEPE